MIDSMRNRTRAASGTTPGVAIRRQVTSSLTTSTPGLESTSERSSPIEDSAYGSIMHGWIMKQGGKVKSWQKRFFVIPLNSASMVYYVNEGVSTPKGKIELEGVKTIQKSYLFVPPDKVGPGEPSGSLPSLQLVTKGRVWNLAFSSEGTREEWLEAIKVVKELETK